MTVLSRVTERHIACIKYVAEKKGRTGSRHDDVSVTSRV